MTSYLDQQVQLLSTQKESEKKLQRDLALAVGRDIEKFKEEQKRQKYEKIQKYRKHQQDVLG